MGHETTLSLARELSHLVRGLSPRSPKPRVTTLPIELSACLDAAAGTGFRDAA